MSVLTDAPFFGGSLADLAAVRRSFAGPILAKDFVVDPRQVAEARLHGADAVLVMLSVLSDEEAGEVIRTARRLGMDSLVEAHDAHEVRRALALGAEIVGINNRNLRTLEVDLGVTERLAPLVPPDRLLVAQSGIGDRRDVERLAPVADAFLVGSALMRAADPAAAATALAFGRVKVCGLTDAHDAEMAAAFGASFAGLVMVPNTPRALTLRQAEPVAAAADRSGLRSVGVFRNEKVAAVAEAVRALVLDAVQLHGEEDSAYIAALRNLLPASTEIWTVGAVGREVRGARAGADRTLFDTEIGGRSGGTGLPFDWSRVRGRPELRRGLLAGGLRAANAGAAARVGAFALDVGSGVEMAPGRKDAGRMHAFFEALRPRKRTEAARC
ncbi:MAG: bifunctional indole-3-glycerol-phosphate synthase TrpC/phosphoribosylanthranilate isomerase TrpF, partial [Pseudomonadota bacterium]|nr:bifunctional indole-3-glycerol-phosphate synthase TrpC/phosphoribosylanthranilate isomerase TrpF [Pseudomonadota bacterium]